LIRIGFIAGLALLFLAAAAAPRAHIAVGGKPIETARKNTRNPAGRTIGTRRQRRAAPGQWLCAWYLCRA
jgi:hypothetical protein